MGLIGSNSMPQDQFLRSGELLVGAREEIKPLARLHTNSQSLLWRTVVERKRQSMR